MGKWLVWGFLVVLLAGVVFGDVLINEIMYNPGGSDEGHEWIEIYSDEVVDLSGWKFYEDNKNHGLTLINGSWVVDGYAIIADKWDIFLVDYPDYNGTLIDSSWGSLSQSGESLALKDNNGEIVDDLTYSDEWGADDNGKTLCIFNNAWQECLATPGHENSVDQGTNQPEPPEETENIILSTYLDDVIYLNNRYTQLFKIKIENKDSCSEKDSVTVRYNITSDGLVKEDVFSREIGCSGTANTGEFTPSEPGDYTLCGEVISSTVEETNFEDNSACMDFTVLDPSDVPCDIVLDITTNGTFIYEKGESIKFKTELNDESFPFEIEYWIEDLFGNIYKNKYTSTNTNQKSWKTNIDEEDRILLIKAVVTPSCNDVNLEDNYAEEMFVVTNVLEEVEEEEQVEEDSSIEIGKISPTEISFGDLVNAEVEVYKNSTGKYSLSAWIKKDNKIISYKTKFHLKSKNTLYKLFLPIQLKPNCNEKIKDGKAMLIIEGLGEKAEKEITVSGISTSLCKEIKVEVESEEEKKLSYQIVDLPMSVSAGEEFKVKVEFDGDDEEHEFKVWSYLYRGSKCYSCEAGERDDNLIEFELDGNEDEEIELLVKVDKEIEEGEYKLKVKLNKDGQKTNKELTESIYVKSVGEKKERSESLCLLSGDVINEEIVVEGTTSKIVNKDILNEVKGIVVYESSSEKANNLIPYIIIAVLGLLCVVLIWRKV